MKRLVVVPGKPLVRYLIIAAFAGLLVGCGGGSSGDSDDCLLYTSPSPRDKRQSRMPSSA